MANTYQIAKQYPQWFFRRNFVQAQNEEIPGVIKVPEIQPRQIYKVKFEIGQDVISTTRKVYTDTYYIETTDLIPNTVRKTLYIDIGVLAVFNPVPSGNFRCEVINEAYYIPYELNEETYDYEPINVLGERLPQTQEEINFYGVAEPAYGSLKKWGSFQEAQTLLLASSAASTEGRNIINIQVSKRRYLPIEFQQNMIYMTISHTADRPVLIRQANLTIVITEVNT